jgi:hypothetical protein
MSARRSVCLTVVFVVVVVAAFGVDLVGFTSEAGARVAAAKAKCTKKPFVGTVERTAEDSATGQPAAERAGADIRSALVFDFGTDENYTVYFADHRLDPGDLGGTLEAPAGDVLITLFLRSANGASLKPGTKLVPGRDPVSVVIDAGGGARAITNDPSGKITILAASKERLCVAVDYRDDHQTVNGVVNARIP